MTYNERKSLYEDIINTVAKTVKTHIDSFSYLIENQEAKSIQSAKRFLMSVTKMNDSMADYYIRIEVRDRIPSLRTKDGGKFILGATRITFDMDSEEDDDFIENMSVIDLIIQRILVAHYEEYDRDFNGLSFEELKSKFKPELDTVLLVLKSQIKNMKLVKNSNYTIYKIKTFEDAEKFYKYTEWCVCDNIDLWWSFTLGDKTPMYFCVRNDFNKIAKIPGENCPYDEYGLSMIAVGVNFNGSFSSCTCRWNHQYGASGMFMNPVELSELLGVNVFEIMKP